MGMLIDGQWSAKDQPRTGNNGEFLRPLSSFRHFIDGTVKSYGKNQGEINDVVANPDYPAVAGRYHLFINKGCPWAYRTLLYVGVKALGDTLSLSFTQAAAGSEGWTFGTEPESLLGARHMHHVYASADPQFTGRATVPVLWDLATNTIVNNESADIIRMLNSAFDALPGVNQTNYYPAAHAAEIDALNDVIYTNVNNGVYRCGFAQTQSAYDMAVDDLFKTLDDLDERLSQRRFLLGDTITEADWRLFATLVRFDLAYHSVFRCNKQRLEDYAHLWPYTRDLYQQPDVAATVDVAAIKGIYFGSRPPGILPAGPVVDFAAPHHRA